jgi:Subtilase family
VASGSVTEPASSPKAFAVGAVCFSNNGLEPFSSQGPNIAGLAKPDIAGPDAVSSGTYGAASGCSGGFLGTSAASPHVAGAAALAQSQNPSLATLVLRQWLQGRAQDLGPPGFDNSYGAGKLQISTFNDVHSTDPYGFTFVETLFKNGITGGCGPINTTTGQFYYCPELAATRRQMAVFIIRSKGEFNPPSPATPSFLDVLPTDPYGYPFVERLKELGITGGCSVDPPLYCPESPVTRRQMAVFVIRGIGEFDPPSPSTPTFTDVLPTDPYGYPFVERMWALKITGGCSTSPLMYCPEQNVTRRQMAIFLVRAFNLS